MVHVHAKDKQINNENKSTFHFFLAYDMVNLTSTVIFPKLKFVRLQTYSVGFKFPYFILSTSTSPIMVYIDIFKCQPNPGAFPNTNDSMSY